mgnify:CR=1 FL=1
MEGHLAVGELLAARGAEASPADGKGMRPLHLAAWFGHLEYTKHLAARGAEASPADGKDNRPLHFAAEKRHMAVAEHLAERGAGAGRKGSGQTSRTVGLQRLRQTGTKDTKQNTWRQTLPLS